MQKNGLDLTIKIGMQRFDQIYVRIIEVLEKIFRCYHKFYPIHTFRSRSIFEEKYFYSAPILDLNFSYKHSLTLFVDEKK